MIIGINSSTLGIAESANLPIQALADKIAIVEMSIFEIFFIFNFLYIFYCCKF